MTLIRVYLAGAIAGCTDEAANNWRQDIIKLYGGLGSPFKFLNPMDRDYRNKHIGPEEEKLIVGLDKIDIASSYAVMFNYTEPTVGTSMEGVYSHMWGKLGVLICKTDKGLSPWWKYHVNKIVYSDHEAIKYIVEQHG